MNRKTALITGASAGLGLEFARQLAAQDYNLVLVARNPERLESAASALRDQNPVDVHTIVSDLSEATAPLALFKQLQALDLHVDYLVNNAGVAGPNLLDAGEWAVHRDFYQLMMLSIAELCHLLIPPMQAKGFGRVLNVASVAGRLARAGGCNYGPSKAWVIAMSEELALTVAKDGVRVTALCPGFTHTEFHERAGLMDMKNASPRWAWYSAETVVREGLAAVERGRSVYASGRLYRWLDPFVQSVWTRRLFSLSDGR